MAPWAVGAFVGSAVGASVLAGLGRRVLHLGLGLMTAGLTWLYFSLSVDGPPIAPLAVFGAGMGMIFVPLFDIIVGDLADDEVGSASGILTSVQQLGASLGIAVLGTVFFSNVDAPAAPAFVAAAKVVTLVAIALTVVTFGLGFLLPRKAKAAAH
jgi:hypothetical protein